MGGSCSKQTNAVPPSSSTPGVSEEAKSELRFPPLYGQIITRGSLLRLLSPSLPFDTCLLSIVYHHLIFMFFLILYSYR